MLRSRQNKSGWARASTPWTPPDSNWEPADLSILEFFLGKNATHISWVITEDRPFLNYCVFEHVAKAW